MEPPSPFVRSPARTPVSDRAPSLVIGLAAGGALLFGAITLTIGAADLNDHLANGPALKFWLLR